MEVYTSSSSDFAQSAFLVSSDSVQSKVVRTKFTKTVNQAGGTTETEQ